MAFNEYNCDIYLKDPTEPGVLAITRMPVTQFDIEPGWEIKYRTVPERDKDGRPTFDKNGKPVTGESLAYDEHAEQLAAGGNALASHELMPLTFRAANFFISTRDAGLVIRREWEKDELDWAWLAFQGRLMAWQGANKYDSAF